MSMKKQHTLYILDFDGVLFDTEAFKRMLSRANIQESDRNIDVFADLTKNQSNFDMKSMVFPDALQFLKKFGDKCVVVSSASSICSENNTDTQRQRVFQGRKLELSGIAGLVDRVYIVDNTKSAIFQEIKNTYVNTHFVVVDDRESYIQEAQRLGIPAILMNREQDTHCASTHITTFDQLESFFQT